VRDVRELDVLEVRELDVRDVRELEVREVRELEVPLVFELDVPEVSELDEPDVVLPDEGAVLRSAVASATVAVRSMPTTSAVRTPASRRIPKVILCLMFSPPRHKSSGIA
jgi:hypothetical protein